MKHTPGPWEYRHSGQFIEGEPGHEETHNYPAHIVSVIRDDEGRRVTRFVAHCEGCTLPNDANAALIAAAPDLLELCKYIRNYAQLADLSDDTVARLDRAIAKAEPK